MRAQFELSQMGVAGIVANFYKADAEVFAAMQDTGRRFGTELQERTMFYTPVLSGFMQDHVKLRFLNDDTAFEVGWIADDFFNAGREFYPFFVEEGTVNMAAQHPLGNAYAEVAPEYELEMRNSVKRAIDRINVAVAK